MKVVVSIVNDHFHDNDELFVIVNENGEHVYASVPTL